VGEVFDAEVVLLLDFAKLVDWLGGDVGMSPGLSLGGSVTGIWCSGSGWAGCVALAPAGLAFASGVEGPAAAFVPGGESFHEFSDVSGPSVFAGVEDLLIARAVQAREVGAAVGGFFVAGEFGEAVCPCPGFLGGFAGCFCGVGHVVLLFGLGIVPRLW